MDIYNHPSIEEVEIDGARIPEINIINNPNLLDMYSNDLRVDELILSGNPSFKTFRFMDLTITDISITNNVNLVSFGGEGFSYTGDLDLSSNQNLERISVIASGSEFKSLKTSSLTKLKVILLSNPFLSTMDFTDNAQLETLIILGSLITSLDAASKPNLVELDVRGPNNICIKVSQDQLDNIPIGWTKDPDDVYSLSCE
ncbi:hypothetical protein [Pareuzebyella sediminis]|uniref:hypothetical protein n=1 Tax=Pareuzebyella sediminis TaxID=2607998 RepID=UPI0011ED1CDD|nr:hypothetical protein [Pareuzebyella sediminis]